MDHYRWRTEIAAVRLGAAALVLLASCGCRAAQQPPYTNSYPTKHGFGAANAGGNGHLPSGPPSSYPGRPANSQGAINSYDKGHGYGAANAGGSGKLPRAPSARPDASATPGLTAQ